APCDADGTDLWQACLHRLRRWEPLRQAPEPPRALRSVSPTRLSGGFSDQLKPLLLIVSRSESRVAQLMTLANRVLPSTVRWRIALSADAGKGLQPLALPPPEPTQLAHAGTEGESAHG